MVIDAAVNRPYVSTVKVATFAPDPYVPIVTAVFGNLNAFNVPDDILFALVVSVVAEVANPDTLDDAIDIAVFDPTQEVVLSRKNYKIS